MATSIFITGASNGIGKGLAYEYASRGKDIALSGRNEQALLSIAEDIRSKYPGVQINIYPLDINQTDKIQSVIEKAASDFQGLDIIVANAGISGGGKVGSGKLAQDIAVINTNVIGAIATIDAAITLFKQQGKGQVVAVSSVAAYRGMPGGGAYSASKAALHTYMEALEAELLGSPITCTTLYPGYIDTDLNKKLKSRPFLISVEQASPIIADLIAKKVTRSTVPVYPWNIVGRLLKVLPNRFFANKKAV